MTTTWRDDAGRDLVRSFGERMALFTRGEGAYLWDDAGRRYLDFLAGIAVNSLGHAHPVFVEAIASQAATLAHVSNYFATEPQLELAARLNVSRSPVRESLQRLVTEGLITFQPSRGFFCRGLDVDQIVHLSDVRAFLEQKAVQLAAEHAPLDEPGARDLSHAVQPLRGSAEGQGGRDRQQGEGIKPWRRQSLSGRSRM